MKNVVIFVNPNAFNEASLNQNQNNIVFQLMQSAIKNNFNMVETIVPANRLAINEILPYIYSKTHNKFEAIYFLSKANIAHNNDDVSRLIVTAHDDFNLQIITEKEGNLSEDFISNKNAILEKQKDKKGKQAFDSRKQGNSKGMFTGGKVPYGYTVALEGHYEINEDEARIIREMFDLYKRGMRAINIARSIGDLYDLKYKNGYWKADRIFGYLSNPLYNGYPTFNRTSKNDKGNTVNLPRSEWEIAPLPFENLKIVDDETFALVQERLWKNDKDKPLDYKLEWEEEKINSEV
jgi:hypothetical protein